MTKIVLKHGDITNEEVDVIVNAANSGLLGGGGVDGAIHRAGGPAILEECTKIRQTKGRLPAGNAIITTAGNLKARYVIHTVGPVWQDGNQNESELLREAYTNSLILAKKNGAKTIAFPSISTGAYGYPIEQAAEIALKTVKEFTLNNLSFSEVRFILFSHSDLEVYQKKLNP